VRIEGETKGNGASINGESKDLPHEAIPQLELKIAARKEEKMVGGGGMNG